MSIANDGDITVDSHKLGKCIHEVVAVDVPTFGE